jgi:outer membrane protein
MKTESLKGLMLYPRQTVSQMLAIMCILLFTSAAMAQTPASPQQSTRPEPQSPPIPERSIGLDPDKVVKWSMRDAILAALDNNVDMEIEKTLVRKAQWSVLQAQGVYDPTLTSLVQYGSTTSPNTFQFSGAGNATSFQTNQYLYRTGFQQLIGQTGGSAEVTFLNPRNGDVTNNLAINYRPSLAFQFTQPLFKNFKIDDNRNRIKIMKKNLDISDAQFRQRAIQIISDVQQAYWNLYVAYENEKNARNALTLAEKQLSDNKRQVEVGTQAPITITEAAATVEQRRTAVFSAMNSVATAENALKVLTVDGPNSELWKTKIETIEPFEVREHSLPLDDAMRLAVANRPELKRLGLQKEINLYNIDFFRNQAKPQIDFVAGYTLQGVGGSPGQGVVTCGPNVTDPNTRCVAPNFVGGYGTSLRNLFGNDFRSWNVGFSFTLPLRNRVAKAQLANAREDDKQTELLTRQMLQNIEVEVRNQLQAVETAKLRIDSTRKQREYAEEQLEGEVKKLQAGLGTNFFVLTRQNDLVNAQVAENQAKSDYAAAVATLQRVLSTTDSENNIVIPEAKVPMK